MHEFIREYRTVESEVNRLSKLLTEMKEAEADVAAAETVTLMRPEDPGEIRRREAVAAVVREARVIRAVSNLVGTIGRYV